MAWRMSAGTGRKNGIKERESWHLLHEEITIGEI
jgi:hypothetical protein